jgi:UDP-N-acetylmuramate dehydrogenase
VSARVAGAWSAHQRQVADALADALGPSAERDAPLGARTTYRVGGPAAVLVEAGTEADLGAVQRALAGVGEPVPVLVVGQGSNLLVADAGFPGLVVVLGPGLSAVEVRGTTVRAGGGAKLPVVARHSAAAGLRGLEWAVGVPGSVGGALRMNAGGHGSDTAASVVRYRWFDLATGGADEAGPERLAFGYRRSALGPGDVVVWAEFALTPGSRADAEDLVAEIVRWRRAHQPGGSNAGSVFTNPPDDAAGRLVELAGCKGLRVGSAHVSDKHANFIQADAGGSADDVRRLMEQVSASVAESLGVNLETEVRLVGFADTPLPTVAALSTSTSTSTGGGGR